MMKRTPTREAFRSRSRPRTSALPSSSSTAFTPTSPPSCSTATEDEGNQDLLDRVARINEDWSTPDIHFPFKPLLGNSQTVIKFDGGMTSDIFQQLVHDQPEEMYDEIRMAYITK